MNFHSSLSHNFLSIDQTYFYYAGSDYILVLKLNDKNRIQSFFFIVKSLKNIDYTHYTIRYTQFA